MAAPFPRFNAPFGMLARAFSKRTRVLLAIASVPLEVVRSMLALEPLAVNCIWPPPSDSIVSVAPEAMLIVPFQARLSMFWNGAVRLVLLAPSLLPLFVLAVVSRLLLFTVSVPARFVLAGLELAPVVTLMRSS